MPIKKPPVPAAAASASAVTTTLIDVAREAGVSPSTVSRILNGTARVAAEKRTAVEAAIRKLDFRPNPAAQSLKMGRTMTVGILTPDIEAAFFARAMVGIEQGLDGTGYAALIVSGHWNAEAEAERLRLLVARRVDGIFVLTGHIDDASLIAFSRHQPIVVTGRALEAPNVRSLHVDQERCGYLATQHLVTIGHRRIAHILGPRHQADAGQRYEGYLRAHREAGLPVDADLVVEGNFREQGGLMAMNRLLDSGRQFTAVFAANDSSAFGARMAMQRRGVRVPDDVSLVGVDDVPAASYLTPSLTTGRQPVYEMGLCAAHVLLAMLGRTIAQGEVPPVDLVVRDTTRRVF